MKVARFSNAQRRTLRLLGAVLFLGGALLVVLTFMDFFSSVGSGTIPTRFWMAFVGAPILFIGAVLLSIGFMRSMAEIGATETEDATTVRAAAVGRGLKEAGFGVGEVRVRCPSCGHLETADAKFCSNCRAPL